MRLATFVTLILAAAAMAGCGVRVHYTYRGYAYGYGHYYGYSTSHGSTGIVWNQPAPPPNVIAAPAPATGELEVTGSDGSYGWEKTCNADVEQHRISEQMARKGCTFESYGYDETRAVCGGVHVLLRRDATHVYRLCPAGTDKQVCMNAWAPVLSP
jgi:hypothetical protein